MQETYIYQIAFGELNISAQDLLDASGNFDPSQMEVLVDVANAVIKEGPVYSDIHAGIVLAPAQITGDDIFVNGITLSPGKNITGTMKPATHAAFFVCTAGLGFENAAHHEMGEGDVLKGYYIDLLGSLTVEKAMDIFQERFGRTVSAEGYSISNRYSPGYCDWKVADQFNLFKLFPDDCCGISLTPSALMSPVKSISGVIAVGPQVKYREHHCDLCNSKTCIYRNIRENQKKH